jgi:hypothetical protein
MQNKTESSETISYLITSDLHLSPSPLHEHRWDIFSVLVKAVQEGNIRYVIIAGDLTDRKLDHPASFVNRLVDKVAWLSNELPDTGRQLIILKGNHDYHVDDEQPFFRFLRHLPRVRFINIPQFIDPNVYAIPHTRDMQQLGEAVGEGTVGYPLCVLHHTFTGAEFESGVRATEDASVDDEIRTDSVYVSGDVHVPQTIRVGSGHVTYVGAPYHIRFGDRFNPRLLRATITRGKPVELVSIPMSDVHLFPRLHKLSIPSSTSYVDVKALIAKADIGELDHVQVDIVIDSVLSDSRRVHEQVVNEINERKALLHATRLVNPVTSVRVVRDFHRARPHDALTRFADYDQLEARIKQAGLDILDEE